MRTREKDLLDLEDLLSKGGPRIRTTNCKQNGHKPVYYSYGYPPRIVKTGEKTEKQDESESKDMQQVEESE